MSSSKKKLWGAAALLFGTAAALLVTTTTGCIARKLISSRYEVLPPGDLWNETVAAHHEDRRVESAPSLRKAVIAHWAERALPREPDGWQLKVAPPRMVLARLEAGEDLENANRFLREMQPWNASGSEWDLREMWGYGKSLDDPIRLGHRGDYDFTQSVLITILHRFADQPDRLLIDRGAPRNHVPRSFGLVPETENHLLMTESARYLNNQWLHANGNTDPRYDNAENSLEEWLRDFLEKILQSGLYEFNSNPYHGYALQPLMNLEAYAQSEHIAGLSRKILDAELWRYVFSSILYKRSAPFRRQLRRAEEQDLLTDRMTQMAAVWTTSSFESLAPPLRRSLPRSHFALDAATAEYCPPAALLSFMRERENHDAAYFVRMGRGRRGSPELYSMGPGYLLAAGGVAPPGSLGIAVRPIVLLLESGGFQFGEYLQIPVSADQRRTSNRTGIHHRFACGDAPVAIPDGLEPEAVSGYWQVYRPMPEATLLVAAYSQDAFGLLALFPNHPEDAKTLLDKITLNNPDANTLRQQFLFPDTGKELIYDVQAPRDQWVIRSVGHHPLNRDFSTWPRLTGISHKKSAASANITAYQALFSNGDLDVFPEFRTCKKHLGKSTANIEFSCENGCLFLNIQQRTRNTQH